MTLIAVNPQLVQIQASHSEDAERHSRERAKDYHKIVDSLPSDYFATHFDGAKDVGVIAQSKEEKEQHCDD